MNRKHVIAWTVLSAVVGTAGGAVAGAEVGNVELGGDLRYRHELIDQEGKASRTRQRLRARLQIDATLEETLDLHFRLASGTDDPVSTNQTLTDGFTSKGFLLDRAYVAWRPQGTVIRVDGGKVANPFRRVGGNELIWDADLSPEGVGVRVRGSGDIQAFLNGGGFWIQERSAAKNTALIGFQAGLERERDEAKVTFGAGYYNYVNLMGPIYAVDDTSRTAGNTLDAADRYRYDFNLIEAFGEIAFPFADHPARLYIDFVENNAADVENQGWLVGVAYAGEERVGAWGFAYDYREVQADAVLGAFTSSDFIGGGTDGKGHRFACSRRMSPTTLLAVTYYLTRVGVHHGVDYGRLQVDANFTF